MQSNPQDCSKMGNDSPNNSTVVVRSAKHHKRIKWNWTSAKNEHKKKRINSPSKSSIKKNYNVKPPQQLQGTKAAVLALGHSFGLVCANSADSAVAPAAFDAPSQSRGGVPPECLQARRCEFFQLWLLEFHRELAP